MGPWINDYRQVSNIRRTLVGNKIVDHSDVVVLDLTHGFIGLGKDNCKTRRGTFKFNDMVRLILEILRYIYFAWDVITRINNGLTKAVGVWKLMSYCLPLFMWI